MQPLMVVALIAFADTIPVRGWHMCGNGTRSPAPWQPNRKAKTIWQKQQIYNITLKCSYFAPPQTANIRRLLHLKYFAPHLIYGFISTSEKLVSKALMSIQSPKVENWRGKYDQEDWEHLIIMIINQFSFHALSDAGQWLISHNCINMYDQKRSQFFFSTGCRTVSQRFWVAVVFCFFLLTFYFQIETEEIQCRCKRCLNSESRLFPLLSLFSFCVMDWWTMWSNKDSLRSWISFSLCSLKV